MHGWWQARGQELFVESTSAPFRRIGCGSRSVANR
jgi:hypothetical protein